MLVHNRNSWYSRDMVMGRFIGFDGKTVTETDLPAALETLDLVTTCAPAGQIVDFVDNKTVTRFRLFKYLGPEDGGPLAIYRALAPVNA